MQTSSPSAIGATLVALREDEIAGPATSAAITYLNELFGRRGAPGIQMATRALRLAIPEEQIATLAPSFITRLLDSVASGGA